MISRGYCRIRFNFLNLERITIMEAGKRFTVKSGSDPVKPWRKTTKYPVHENIKVEEENEQRKWLNDRRDSCIDKGMLITWNDTPIYTTSSAKEKWYKKDKYTLQINHTTFSQPRNSSILESSQLRNFNISRKLNNLR